jgi:hypothetical protein
VAVILHDLKIEMSRWSQFIPEHLPAEVNGLSPGSVVVWQVQWIIFGVVPVPDRKPVSRHLDLTLMFEMEIIPSKIGYGLQIMSFQYRDSPAFPNNEAAGP